jgi:soluble lytic murein transglycosylase-like protein
LVVQSSILGSILLSLFGFLVPPAQATRTSTNLNKTAVPVQQVSNGRAAASIAPALEAAQRCELPNEIPSQVRQWCGLITRYALENELPPQLVAAVIFQESSGQPLAYSKSGAVGLMQVMPRDGLAAQFQCPNGPCFADRPTISELEDPEFNIAYGTRMLAGLIRRYQSVREALKAYGPMDMGYGYADIVLAHYDRFTAGD